MPDQNSIQDLSLTDLEGLQKEVSKRIDTVREQERNDAFAKVEALAESLGLTKQDMAERFGGRTRRQPVAAKYQNPKNASETWSGRGRQPGWVKSHLESGRKREELAIG